MTPLRKPSILIVDDSAAVCGAIRQFIEANTCYEVCAEANDGVAAIRKAKEFRCDMVVLDLSMPNLNGVEAAFVIKGILPKTKIVGFTVYATEFRSLTARAGFDLVLSKEDGISNLVEAIKTLLPVSIPEPETPSKQTN